ncbi:MAG: hypothetical protein ACTHU1_13300 [Arachnia sp.]
MLNRTENATNALRAFERTGTKLPTPVRAALDRAAHIRAFIAANTSSSLPRVILAAIAVGTDPATDPDVAAATARALWAQPGTASALQQAAEAETVRAVHDNADALVAAMVPAFDAAVADLRKAHAVLGDVDLRADHAHILGMGSKAATAWVSAIAAVEVTNDIASAWSAIAQVARWHEYLFAARMVQWDANRWVGLHHEQRHLDVGADTWAAIRNGWTLRLADSATLHEFETDIAEAQHRAREAAEQRKSRHAIFAGR